MLITILLIVVVHIASCSSRHAQRVVSYLPTFLCFRAKCGSSIYRCTLDRMNRTGLSHCAWNPLRVCECDKSICCDVPYLDSQRDSGAMTHVVQTPFALTRQRPEGKCPDTAASRRKMPRHGCVQKENALRRSVQKADAVVSCVWMHGAVASCVPMYSAMANCFRVKQVVSEASRASSASGRLGRNFFFS